MKKIAYFFIFSNQLLRAATGRIGGREGIEQFFLEAVKKFTALGDYQLNKVPSCRRFTGR